MSLVQAVVGFGIQINVTMVILTVALLLARVLPVIVLSPVLGGEVVPTEVKIGMGLLLSMVLYPLVADRPALFPTSALPFIATLLKELFIGVCLAFIVNMVFEAARLAGTLIDTLAGTSMAELMVPQLQIQSSIWSSLQFQLTAVLFLTLNGHHLVINALADSLRDIPLDRFPAFSGGAWAFFETSIRVSADLLAVGLGLCAPALLVILLTDVAFGIINKVAPQIQVHFMAMSIKPLVATLVVLVSLPLMAMRLSEEFGTMFRFLRQALRALA
jgi:flagellar biosynthesis protein FliR